MNIQVTIIQLLTIFKSISSKLTMAARRGDKFVENNISDVTAKHETEVNNVDIERNGDQTPLVDPELIESENESTYEYYTGFQKITTIPAAALSLVAGFIMIASVSVTI